MELYQEKEMTLTNKIEEISSIPDALEEYTKEVNHFIDKLIKDVVEGREQIRDLSYNVNKEVTDQELRSDLVDTYRYFGFESQIRKLQEEVDELKVELRKYEEGEGDIDNVTKEMADVFNILYQFKEINEITESELYEARNHKNERTKTRVINGYYRKES